MYTLPCPHCQHSIQVAPSQAGDELACPSCGAVNQIPKLGDLRQLPQTTANAGISGPPAGEARVGRQIGFVVLSLLSLACLLIAVFCGIRWVNVDAPVTTEIHLQTIRDRYAELTPAELIREFEDLESYDLAIAAPYAYKQLRNRKNAWGRNALIATVFCVGCGITAMLLAGSGSKSKGGTE